MGFEAPGQKNWGLRAWGYLDRGFRGKFIVRALRFWVLNRGIGFKLELRFWEVKRGLVLGRFLRTCSFGGFWAMVAWEWI